MAVTLDFGKCSQCGDNNSKSVKECRKCGAPLPWAKQAPVVQASPSSGGGFSLGNYSTGFYVQILGGLITIAGAFLWLGNVLGFFPTFRGAGKITLIIGIFIWGAGAAMPDNE